MLGLRQRWPHLFLDGVFKTLIGALALASGFVYGQTRDPDCSKRDPAKPFKMTYSYLDRDRDGFFDLLLTPETKCLGASELKFHRVAIQPSQRDCEDTNKTIKGPVRFHFRDEDGDGRYVSSAGLFCAQDPEARHYSRSVAAIYRGDCDDRNPQVWRTLTYNFVDRDGDELFVRESGSLCVSTLPAGYASNAQSPLDTDDNFKNVFDHTASCNSLQVLERLNLQAGMNRNWFAQSYSWDPSVRSGSITLSCFDKQTESYEQRQVGFVDFVFEYAGPAVFNFAMRELTKGPGNTPVSSFDIDRLAEALYVKYFSNIAPNTSGVSGLKRPPQQELRVLRDFFEAFFSTTSHATASACAESGRRGNFRNAIKAFLSALLGLNRRDYDTKLEKGSQLVGSLAGSVVSYVCPQAATGLKLGAKIVSYAAYKRKRGTMGAWRFLSGYYFRTEIQAHPCACAPTDGNDEPSGGEEEYRNYWNFKSHLSGEGDVLYCSYQWETVRNGHTVESGTGRLNPGDSLDHARGSFFCPYE